MLASWTRRFTGAVQALLRQGLTPERIALALAFGLAAGIFPVIGATTILALALGLALGLNQAALQLANWVACPLQLVLILPLVRLGEWALGVPPTAFQVTEVVARVKADPAEAVATFGMTGLHGILGWLMVLPLVIPLAYRLLLPALRDARRRLAAERPRSEGAGQTIPGAS